MVILFLLCDLIDVMLVCKVLWEFILCGGEWMVLLKMFCVNCGFMFLNGVNVCV